MIIPKKPYISDRQSFFNVKIDFWIIEKTLQKQLFINRTV